MKKLGENIRPFKYYLSQIPAPSPACPVVTGVCEPRASCLTHVYPFSIPSGEGPPAPNPGKCKIHLSHQGCQNWSAFPTRMMLLLRTRETGKKSTVSILTEKEMAPHSSTLAWKIPWTEAVEVAGPLGTPLGLAQRKRASSPSLHCGTRDL